MRIGVVSDTHGDRLSALAAVRLLESLDVDLVLHCGDVGGAEIPELFAAWPAHFVCGNVDRPAELAAAVGAGRRRFHGAQAELQLAGRQVTMMHGDDATRLEAAIESGRWDLVCCGHTHVAEIRREGRTLLVNPGALHRATPHTLAVVDLAEMNAMIFEV